MHIHLGVTHLITTFLGVIIVGFFWRLASMKWSNTSLGKGMAFVY
jgi:hypothetical protein